MQLKTFVKVGNITNLSDARYCAGMGVDVLGFKLEEDATSVSSQLFEEISGWLSGTAFAGEFINSDAQTIRKKATDLKLEYVQVNDIQLANELSNDFKVIYQLDIETEKEVQELSEKLSKLEESVQYALIDTSEKNLEDLLAESLQKTSSSVPILKAFDVDESNVLKSLETTAIAGIALYGSNEIRPGFKDYDELADILETLEVED